MKNGNKTVLITDAGGRGAALVDKYGQSKHVGKILVVPGNDLMQININKPVITFPNLKTTSVSEILKICDGEKVDLVDVSQDNAVEAGLVDELYKQGVLAVGPTRLAGQIEWDKAWARSFMKKYNIPSPIFNVFTSQKEGVEFAKKHPKSKWFVKASGLAEGKGAIPAPNLEGAISAIKQMQAFNKSGETYLLEEWLIGEEFSAFALCDGQTFKVVGYAQDHKRVNDKDKGPNTGGMGCVSNPLIIDVNIKRQIKEIFKKTINGLKDEKRPYKGILYLGGIVVNGKVFVIEFNARWGDPEAEVILPSIKNDLYELGMAVANGTIGKINIRTDNEIRVAVAGCSKGYPINYSTVKGKKVSGIEKVKKIEVKVYGAGIKKINKDYVVNGGRVFYIVSKGKNIIEARARAYEAMSMIYIEGDNLHYRTDIGWRDVERIKR